MGACTLLYMVLSSFTATPNSNDLMRFDLPACLAALPADQTLQYDTVKLVCSLQGLVNRQHPQLILRFLEEKNGLGENISIDDYWLDYCRKDWLKNYNILEEKDLYRLLKHYASYCQGTVYWDPAVPATANVAATLCGVEGWLPLRSNSPLIPLLQQNGVLPPVKCDLTGRFTGAVSGSAKCDAYLWAVQEYLAAGKCNPVLMAYYVDAYPQSGDSTHPYPDLSNATLTNHDYYKIGRAHV